MGKPWLYSVNGFLIQHFAPTGPVRPLCAYDFVGLSESAIGLGQLLTRTIPQGWMG